MKTKGAAAEITEDAGLLKNYIEPKGKKGEKKKRARKPKKTKHKTYMYVVKLNLPNDAPLHSLRSAITENKNYLGFWF